jgi:3-dehydroquinate synthase class II
MNEYGITLSVTVMVTGPIPNALDATDWAVEAVQNAIDSATQVGNMHLVVESIEDAGIAWQVLETAK